MDEPRSLTAELETLLAAAVDERLTEAERARLEELLREDGAALECYVEQAVLHAMLRWEHAPPLLQEGSGIRDQGSGAGIGDSGLGIRDSGFGIGDSGFGIGRVPSPEFRTPSPQSPTPSPESRTPGSEPLIPPIIIDTSATIRYPLSTIHSPLVGWLLSYAAATVIVGTAILGAWLYKVSLGGGASAPPAPIATNDQPRPLAGKPELVGQITGTADCRWADPQNSPVSRDVALGQGYSLLSGLVEISYATGAKVILQGPCMYQVESPRGGFLSLGKLTARVERSEVGGQGSEIRNQKSEISNPQSLIPNPLFVVRTPTAVVTDLGTEFGVEVDRQGRTESHVFVGKVTMVPIGGAGKAVKTATLGAGQSARCQKGNPVEMVPAAAAAPERFARSLMPEPVRIVERFDGPKLGPAIEQSSPGRYAIGHGAAVYQQPAHTGGRQSRGYIRTVASDFCDCDFVCEVTVDVRLDASDPTHSNHQVFFGIGSGEPNHNYNDEMTCGLAMNWIVDSGQIYVHPKRPEWGSGRDVPEQFVADFVPSGPLGPGHHRLQMVKRGKWLQFLVDADHSGEFQTDFQCRYLDLAAVMPLLNATNSRLVLGTGNCDTMSVRFEDLSIVYTKTPGSKGKPAMNGP